MCSENKQQKWECESAWVEMHQKMDWKWVKFVQLEVISVVDAMRENWLRCFGMCKRDK